MADLDILADLDAAPQRPKGTPCAIAKMRRDRPELVPQWEAVLRSHHTVNAIATWFTVTGGFSMSKNVPERHRQNPPCTWCIPGKEITA